MTRRLIFRDYHEATSLSPGDFATTHIAGDTPMVQDRKLYPRLKHTQLPLSDTIVQSQVDSTLTLRRSTRRFARSPLTLSELSHLLHFSAGVMSFKSAYTVKEDHRPYPSAGAKYPLELYVIVFRQTEGLDCGIYHYDPRDHQLIEIDKNNHKDEVMSSVGDRWIAECGVLVVISAVFSRTMVKYGDRGYRYILIETGHLAQNLCVVAGAMNVGICAIGGYIDQSINALIGIDGTSEAALYLLAVGHLGIDESTEHISSASDLPKHQLS